MSNDVKKYSKTYSSQGLKIIKHQEGGELRILCHGGPALSKPPCKTNSVF